jgi:cysteinyl-tRNA synthetase
MHNGFLTMDAEKMSKSLGNVLLVHDLVKQVPGEVIRWALLSGHYRAPLDWTGELIAQSRKSLDRLYGALLDAGRELSGAPEADDAQVAARLEPLHEALEDDLNTPRAAAELFELAGAVRAALLARDLEAAAAARAALLAAGAVLGFLQQDPTGWFEGGADEGLKSRVEQLLADRLQARASKDWPTADRIRAELDGLGVVVMDGPQGATWRLKEPA